MVHAIKEKCTAEGNNMGLLMLKQIQEQQKAMGYIFDPWDEKEKWAYFRDISLALIKEASEVLDEVPWKPWKPIKSQTFNEEKAALEICDVMVFSFVLWNTLDPAISFEEAWQKTMDKIETRIKKTNYGKQE